MKNLETAVSTKDTGLEYHFDVLYKAITDPIAGLEPHLNQLEVSVCALSTTENLLLCSFQLLLHPSQQRFKPCSKLYNLETRLAKTVFQNNLLLN